MCLLGNRRLVYDGSAKKTPHKPNLFLAVSNVLTGALIELWTSKSAQNKPGNHDSLSKIYAKPYARDSYEVPLFSYETKVAQHRYEQQPQHTYT